MIGRMMPQRPPPPGCQMQGVVGVRQGVSWSLCALLCLSFLEQSQCRGSRQARETKEYPLLRAKRTPTEDVKKCSYTFLIPQQKITGQCLVFCEDVYFTPCHVTSN